MTNKTEKPFIEIGTRFRNYRKYTLKLTHEQLAERLDVGVRTLTYIENGRRKPSTEILSKLAAEFGGPVEQIITGKSPSDKGGVKTDSPLSMSIRLASLEARVDQLERLLTGALAEKL